MYCKKCGKELLDDAKFCPECGTSVEEVVEEVKVVENEVVAEEPKQPKCWSIFAKVGFGCGLGGLICACTFIFAVLALEVSSIGLVFSILGKKSNEFKSKAKAGLILSIIGLVLSLIFVVILAVAVNNVNIYY